MNRSMRKTTFREISKSLGRYIAIVAITALGVGFFAGLKICKTDMVNAGNAFVNENLLYDYKLMNSYGYEEEDVAYIQQLDEVAYAEGGYSYDVLYDFMGTNGVAKAHSMTDSLNQLKLFAGRLPEAPDECVLDYYLFPDFYEGQVFEISELNEEDTADVFVYDSYKVVGIVASPAYLNYDRGTTSLGNGTVEGFVYMLPEGFDSSVYTEIYVRLTEEHYLYSEEYDDYLDSVQDDIELAATEASRRRFDSIVSEAEEELLDGEQELADALEEGEQELADAYEELTDAEAELADGWQEYEDGKQELADAQTEIADAEIEIADAETELADAETEIADAEIELADAKAELDDALAQITEGQQEIEDARYEINNGFYEISLKQEELDEAQRTLDENGELVNSGIGQVENGIAQIKYALEQIAIYEPQKDTLLASKTFLETQMGNIAAANPTGYEQDPAYQTLLTQYTDVMTALGLLDSKSDLLAKLTELQNTYNYLQTQYEACLEAQRQIDAGNTAICQAKGELYAAREELAEAEAELADARVQYADGLAQYEEGVQELADAKQEVANAYQELYDAKLELEDAKQEVEDAYIELADAEAELTDAETEIADGWKEYYEGKEEFETETADAREELDEGWQELRDLEEPSTYTLDRESNAGVVCFENDTAIVESIAIVFPVFFFLVVALICVTTMNRMIEEQRTQIGVLKAIGYSSASIMGKYLFYSGSAALVGSLIGFYGGCYLFPKTIWMAYSMMYNFSDIEYVFDWKIALVSISAAMLCTMGTTWLSCRNELQRVPAELIRPKAPKAGKRIFMEYITFIWKRMPFLHKVSIRNIFRYKRRFFMMIIGIGGCTALLVAGFGLRDSIVGIADLQYGEIEVYDFSVILDEEINEDIRNSIEEEVPEGLEGMFVLHQSSVDVMGESAVKTATLMVPQGEEEMNSYLMLRNTEGEILDYPAFGEVILSDKIAKKIGAAVGDEIVLRDTDMNEISVTVSGIYKNYVNSYAFISSETYENAIGAIPEYKSILVNVEEGCDIHETAAAFMKAEGVLNVSVNEDMLEQISNMMNSMNYIIILVIACAAMLAFVVLYNLTNINITERIREIATIKVLGFYSEETASYVFRENVILTAIGGGVGLLMGKAFHVFIMTKLDIDMVSFSTKVEPLSFLYSFLLTLLFAMLVNIVMYFKLEKVDMAESLKSIE